jgi:hypothetical protein
MRVQAARIDNSVQPFHNAGACFANIVARHFVAAARGWRGIDLALLNQMKKRDWAFVAACVAGAVLFGVWSFQMGIAFHRSQQGATDLSSSHRRSQNGSSASGPARLQADDGGEQAGQPR